MSTCLECGKKPKRNGYKYCSNRCQRDFQYKLFIAKWLEDSKQGITRVATVNISRHIKRYLRIKHKDTCSICGWSQRHPITNIVPLEVDHIDGNASNNTEANIRILCPNCHSLTPSFRNLNKGKGRMGRKKRSS